MASFLISCLPILPLASDGRGHKVTENEPRFKPSFFSGCACQLSWFHWKIRHCLEVSEHHPKFFLGFLSFQDSFSLTCETTLKDQKRWDSNRGLWWIAPARWWARPRQRSRMCGCRLTLRSEIWRLAEDLKLLAKVIGNFKHSNF